MTESFKQMHCKKCGREMSYDFRISNKSWLEANGKKSGVLCAHCTLESLGLRVWNITEDKDSIPRIIHLNITFCCFEDFLKRALFPKTKILNPLPTDAKLIHFKIDHNHQTVHLFYQSVLSGTKIAEGQMLENVPVTDIIFETIDDN